MSSEDRSRRLRLRRTASVVFLVGGILLIALAAGSTLLRVPLLGIFLAAQAFWQMLLAAAVIVLLIGLAITALSRKRDLLVLSAVVSLVATAGLMVSMTTRSQVTNPAGIQKTGELRILSWNTNQQDVSVEQLEHLILKLHPNVVALPEYFPQVAKGTLSSVAGENDMQIVGSENSSATLLVSKQLGDYRIVDAANTPAWAGFLAQSSDAAAPPLLVAHLQRPSIVGASTWASHIAWVRDACSTRAGVVAVGDFNGTDTNIRSAGQLACDDAASSLGIDSTGTWPANLPGGVGAAIDHVMATKNWKARSYAVLGGQDAGGSDHRPIFVTLDKRM
ncbi:endonuclease/exonuclease/phosphatase family protein [Curtobacterium aetherium]|uniref:Endonuclease/exonuclease/phosphatase family protein n=1 Tax=Curtobacterium aetherium TaxID=2841594 RepID=A0ACD1E2W7_9MICO|nr:endonuclease/exonuclease/phosphatase family protein [Curtobacterium sp. L6-1]QWS33240.1 endonuclease/exonuclease/phosphatase family protein [Curtobacterium sp. L6-1]